MKTVGDRVEAFRVVGVKPGFNQPDEAGKTAFETLTEASFPGKWKVLYFYPKDFTAVCSSEVAQFNRLAKQFEDRDAVLLGGSTDNELCKLAWRRENGDLSRLGHWTFADTAGSLVDQLGVRDPVSGVARRATFIVDPDNVIQHVSVNNGRVGRSPQEVLRLLDAIITDELCPAERALGGATL